MLYLPRPLAAVQQASALLLQQPALPEVVASAQPPPTRRLHRRGCSDPSRAQAARRA
jgi:hypothetical protein